MQNKPSILITGAAGTVGRIVFMALKADGLDVRGFDRSSCTWDQNANWITGSLTSPMDCRKALKGRSILIHLAAVPDEAPFETDLMPSNILGLHNILEAARIQGAHRILLASTGQVVWTPLNEGPWPVSAQHPPDPRSWYAMTKIFAECAGKVYARDHGMDVMSIRLGACPRDSKHAQEISEDPIARDAYLSPNDLATFFRLAVSIDWRGYHCLNATSQSIERERLSLSEAKSLLGFFPKDHWPVDMESFWSPKEKKL